MKHNSYYPTNVPEQILWLTNFFNKLIGHAPALGVSVAACAAAVADARWLVYLLGAYQPALKAWAKSCTDVMKEAQSGTGMPSWCCLLLCHQRCLRRMQRPACLLWCR